VLYYIENKHIKNAHYNHNYNHSYQCNVAVGLTQWQIWHGGEATLIFRLCLRDLAFYAYLGFRLLKNKKLIFFLNPSIA
jgi:hypothetical protein